MKLITDIRFLVLVCTLLLSGCLCNERKSINPRISLWHKDRIPYGTWFAYNSLQNLYGDSAFISVKSDMLDHSLVDTEEWSDDYEIDSLVADLPVDSLQYVEPPSEVVRPPKLYIVVGQEFFPTTVDIVRLEKFVNDGNHLVIAAGVLSDEFLTGMGVQTQSALISLPKQGSANYKHRTDSMQEYTSFGYPGFRFDQSFILNDSVKWTILGETAAGKPNCIRREKGTGTITLHANPLMFTNFFLLHKNNHTYFTSLLSGLPSHYSVVWWDEYFRQTNYEKKGFSSLGVLLKYPSLKWALITSLIVLGLLLISETKRRQKVIPVIPPPDNPSLDFVRTIGRLYYHAKDNENLARKIESHFRDFIRQHYGISGHQPDASFARQLALKTGVEEALVLSLLQEFKMIEEHGMVPDGDLLRINELIEQFHKNRT